ncbi:MAG: threonine--tRNA ligase [Nitrospira sp.]|nr:threonine--tRNA ligase [Candidatus Manganitrophaceae bacterium]HIL35823.1 threonine--tRNA ligase [Candidatus Manganitrophaceae bacterium]
MAEVTLKFKSHKALTVEKGIPFFKIVKALEKTKDVVGVCVNGEPRDLSARVEGDAEIELLTFDAPEGEEIYRHSSSHLMAQAVKEVFPSAQMAIGPPIKDGFYYDFDFERPFTPEDLKKIEKKMKEIVKRNLPISRMELTKEVAIQLFRERQEPYKVELIEELEDVQISAYQQGDFIDLCTGPHLPSTGKIKAIKLLSSAGAYWRGSEKNKMLQRIYGTSFSRREDLDAHLKNLEEIKKRDHRRLGKELDLFSITDEIGAGLVLWHPKGAIIRKTLEDFWRDAHLKAGYDLVFTPHMAKLDLWKQSGHLEFYKENMYAPMKVDNIPYEIKPMNCPFHILIYKSRLRSYRDLPFRWAELGTVYRYERSGVLHGLMRVRGFTQDDAHLFCRPDQIEAEILKVLDFTTFVLGTFGFKEYEIYLSTRPDKYVGTLDRWEQATTALEGALKQKGLPYEIDPGEGVFYGPKIDMKIKDALGRSWQCTTIQVDFNLPDRFKMSYRGEDGQAHQPIMIHRALMGSIERFFGVLIEHYAGAFPLWLAPVQAKVIPITERQKEYAEAIKARLHEAGIRVEVDQRNEKMGLKIREAQLMKIPYMLVVGDREAEDQTLSVRNRRGENSLMEIDAFLNQLQGEIEAQKIQ